MQSWESLESESDGSSIDSDDVCTHEPRRSSDLPFLLFFHPYFPPTPLFPAFSSDYSPSRLL